MKTETLQHRGFLGDPASIRLLVGITLTTAISCIFVAFGFWLGYQLVKLMGQFYGFSIGSWLATGLLYTMNRFRPLLEQAMITELEGLLLFEAGDLPG